MAGTVLLLIQGFCWLPSGLVSASTTMLLMVSGLLLELPEI